MVGHVDHGKTTLTQALTGKWTDQHSEELKRGISIKLGYADAEFYKVIDKKNTTFTSEPNLKNFEGAKHERLRTVSFVDAPGHETLMAVMLSGAAIMDAAILIIAANEKCPQPQTREHLSALEIMGFEKFIVVQSKIDICSKERALESYKEIKEFLKGSLLEDAPIVPVSAHHNKNIDLLIEVIENLFPTPEKNTKDDFQMDIARSFDINKPGTIPKNIKGGIFTLPLKFAVWLLKDKRGDIELDIPVKGNINDPEVNAWKLVGNTLKRKIFDTTSNPVIALANYIDAEPEDIRSILYEYPDTILTENQKRQLDLIE